METFERKQTGGGLVRSLPPWNKGVTVVHRQFTYLSSHGGRDQLSVVRPLLVVVEPGVSNSNTDSPTFDTFRLGLVSTDVDL